MEFTGHNQSASDMNTNTIYKMLKHSV